MAQVRHASLPEAHGHQVNAPAELSLALVMAERCRAGKIATLAPGAARPTSVGRRLERTLANDRLGPDSVWPQPARATRAGFVGGSIALILDETPNRNLLRCLRLTPAYRERALLLSCACYAPGGLAEPMPAPIVGLLRKAAACLPEGAEATLLADRGLRWPQVVDACAELGRRGLAPDPKMLVLVRGAKLPCFPAVFKLGGGSGTAPTGPMGRGGMLRNRYDRTDLFALVPQLGLRFEPQLEQLDRLLDDDELFEMVRADLARRHPRTTSRGRPSTPVEVILRMLVVMRLYSWSYEQAEYFINDSLVLRQFCRVYLAKVPDDTTLIRWANTIGPEALQALNDRVVQLARSLKVTRGRKLRVDTTAIETDIHFPTDSGLVGDGVRVVSRLLRRARAAPGEAASGLKEAFRSRVRAVRRLSQQLHRIARRKGDQGREALKAAYGRLVGIGKRAAAQGRRVLEALRGRGDDPAARRLAGHLEEVLPRLKRAVGQAERRVLKDDPVPSGEKLVSLFESHTQVIPRFKAGKPAEFGRKVRLDEVEGGLITGYAVLEQGGGQDQPYLPEALANHRRQFGRPPRLLAADRGMASAENERLAKEAGVKHVALPHVGKAPPPRRAEEKGRRFRAGYRFRAGIEGRIHALKRDHGLKRCRYRGERGFGRWVGWGILAHNLARVAKASRG